MRRLLTQIRTLSKFNNVVIKAHNNSDLLVPSTKNRVYQRKLYSSSNQNQMPKTPDLIYMPHILRWLKTKMHFKYLRKAWDPEFSEGAFIYGTTQAVCRITEIIHRGKLEELDGLLTDSAKIKLADDITYRLTATQKDIILLKPEDIKIFVPTHVTFTKDGSEKVVRVNLRILALKWFEQAKDMYRLVLVVLQTEFLRDYSDDANQEWTISGFTILECGVLTQATTTH